MAICLPEPRDVAGYHMTMQETARQVVLVGAGHAHLYVARRAQQFRQHGIKLTLIDPDAFWYSGLATGMLGGMYDRDIDRIDAGTLIERFGGTHIQDRVVGINRNIRTVTLASGQQVHYDALSLNIGSQVASQNIPGVMEYAWQVKPIANLWKLRQHIEQRATHATVPLHITVIGGGATGCEVAANLAALLHKVGIAGQVRIITRSDRLLRRSSSAVSDCLADALKQRGIEIVAGCTVASIGQHDVACEDGKHFASDITVLAAGLEAHRALQKWGLAQDATGMAVDATLCCVQDKRIFGAGDCINFAQRDLPKLGVYSVRESPILTHNLLAAVTGGRLRKYRPQRNALMILNLGDGEGLAVWGSFYWCSRWSMWLKDRIDQRFLNKYRMPIRAACR